MRSGLLHPEINGSHEPPGKTQEKVLPKEEFSLVPDCMPRLPFFFLLFVSIPTLLAMTFSTLSFYQCIMSYLFVLAYSDILY
jgi:hypothetical protein